jgi:hypothetical protein
MESIVSYLLAAMIAWVPLQAHAPVESTDDVRSRYESIARDAVSVAFDESEAPLLDGEDGRLRTALLMLSVASYESFYQKMVDEGLRRGDNGRSVCLMQIRVGEGKTREGWRRADLLRDRTLCFRAGLHILHASFDMCRRLPVADRMSAYATGHCFANAQVSRSRVARARAWWTSHAPPPPEA